MTFDELVDLMQPGDRASLRDLLVRPAWMRHAACRGETRLFFLERGDNPAPAKAICASCPVVVDCEAYAASLPKPVHGVWGGSQAARRKRAA